MSGDVECTMLAEFLECSHQGESERLLEKLIHEQAAPIVERIVAFKVRGGPAEDVRGDVLADLIARLRELKESADNEIIRDFRAYAAVTAYNRCHEYYRRCFPQRHRLETRLRYLLGSHSRLALWIAPDGDWICGDKAICDQLAVDENRGEAVRLVETILDEHGGPMPLDDLVERVARHWGISDWPETPGHDRAQEIASVETKLMQRDGLRLLWREISRLPVAQRISLLLNMREEGGGAALTLLPLTGVATIGEIAATLEMPEAELALMWNGLPVDDLRIAARLSLNRQQVISLRRTARERLKRGAGVAARADGPQKAMARPTKRKR
jgi:hypothetical protein